MPTLLTDADVRESRTVSIDAERLASAPSRLDTCHACGATHTSTTEASYLRRGDARFCPACCARLTGMQVAAIVREVALRGVPLS